MFTVNKLVLETGLCCHSAGNQINLRLTSQTPGSYNIECLRFSAPSEEFQWKQNTITTQRGRGGEGRWEWGTWRVQSSLQIDKLFTKDVHVPSRQPQSSGAVWKWRWTSWAPVPNKLSVSVDEKQQWTQFFAATMSLSARITGRQDSTRTAVKSFSFSFFFFPFFSPLYLLFRWPLMGLA